MSDKLDIRNEMRQFDRKNRNFYRELSDEERKKFSSFLMIRWGSAVEPNPALGAEENYMLQCYYLQSTNERLNKNFFDVSASRHAQLQWLCCTTVSPGMGEFRHGWISPKKKTTDNKSIKFLRKLYPTAKDDELLLLSKINDKADLKQLAEDMGYSKEDIKREL